MARIAIIVGNPLHDSYSEALGKAYQRGAESGGHQAQLFMLGRMNFDAILREGYRREQPLEPDLVAAREAFVACDHVVFVFPLWCGDMPALMKGFFERVLQSDLLTVQKSGGKASWKMFKNKSARVIMTMGMPGWFYRWYFGAHALKLLRRNILQFVGITPVRSTIYGMIEAVGDDKRKVWLREVEALGHEAR
ncbi:MAG: NAD(P)H-dependent oxidoreductase [Pseudolabrys sp.]|nr:NAD(P)H-dependent oxidoreductase [Pseudolabrys sp.]MDP2296319.1 NAD(P)H-dependent oxidoreductase [Pseudolabrys sp.]